MKWPLVHNKSIALQILWRTQRHIYPQRSDTSFFLWVCVGVITVSAGRPVCTMWPDHDWRISAPCWHEVWVSIHPPDISHVRTVTRVLLELGKFTLVYTNIISYDTTGCSFCFKLKKLFVTWASVKISWFFFSEYKFHILSPQKKATLPVPFHPIIKNYLVYSKRWCN